MNLTKLRLALLCAALLSLSSSSFAQLQQPSSRTPNTPTRQIELTVKVAYYDNDRPVQGPIRVQVVNHMGVPVMETFSRDGEARFPGIPAGTYRLRASSPDIEETQSDMAFTVSNWTTVHLEYIRVKRKAGTGQDQPQSTEGTVSAAMLNIPDKARKEFDKGLDALEKKNFAEAHKRFEKASALYPRYAAALNNLGFIAMQGGDAATGETFFERAIAADEQYAGAYINLAKLRWAQKRFPEAEKLLTKHTALDPQAVESLALLANLNAMTGRHEETVVLTRKAHSLPHQDYAIVHYIAGMSHQAKNQWQEAAVEFRQYLKEAPQGKSADNARIALQNVEQRLAAK